MIGTPLLANYRGVICDLDGVVYKGSSAVPGAIETLNAVSAAGVPIIFATNNASRPPAEVEKQLRRLGLTDDRWSVVTSAQAAASHLRSRLAPGTRVFAVGGPGVAQALADEALIPLRLDDLPRTTGVAAVVQGAGADVDWRQLAEVAHLARQGAMWVATNLDATVPTARGLVPGNGALVAAVQCATTAVPYVSGKPGPALFALARSRLGTARGETIVVGDRLDTDIAGAHAAGLDSLFVLGGASSLRDLVFVAPAARPTYVGLGLTGLLEPGLIRLERSGDLGKLSADGEIVVADELEPRQLLQLVLTIGWQALDEQRELSAGETLWNDLERRIIGDH